MTRSLSLAFVAPVGFAAALFAFPAGAEEFTVVSQVTANRGGGGTQTLYVGEHKLRSSDGETDTIVDYGTGTITFVEHKKKRYWQTTPAEMQAQFAELSAVLDQNPLLGRAFGKAAEANVEKLGSRTIAGHECDDYRVTVGEAYSFDVCAARDLKPDVDVHAARRVFAANMGPMAGKMSKLFDALAKIEGLALASTMKINVFGANMVVTTEATEVKVGDLGDDVFALPAGYKSVKSPFAKK